ncbi:MAG: PQQ-like beta-propeller repeat protein [Planctomycetaceae bacterium]|nr:PQQ-like beta-propeller repeat protein [Planctomycetaceae bacterium]
MPRPLSFRCWTAAPLLLLIALAAVATRAQAENWPEWRGPQGNGISSETGLPIHWSQTENVAWRTPLPGPGGATPVVWEDHIFLTATDGPEEGAALLLLCLGTDGKIKWQRTVGEGNQKARAEEGNSASPSPVTDGQYVWAFFGTGVLACYDFDGNEVWKFNVQDRFGKFDIQFGMTSTPVLHGDHLYLQLLHGSMSGGDYIVGKIVKLEKTTGKDVWVQDRPTGAIAENRHSYASPVLFPSGERLALLTHGQDHTIAFDLESGKELWRLGGLNGPTELNHTPFDRTLRFVASPTVAEGLAVIPTAKKGPTIAVNLTAADGEINPTGDAIRWVNDKTPDVPCPLIVDGLVYHCRQDGKLFVVDAQTGEELYYERTHDHNHRASPLYADGHIYLTARDGHFTVVKAGRKFEVASENDLGEAISASPVISNGTLYLRTFNALYAVRE